MSRTLARTSPVRVMPRDRQRRPDGRPLGDLFLRPGERPSERRPRVTDDHQPVMVEEVLHFLSPVPGGVYVDATVGAGGHAEAILRATGGRCVLVGLDRDPEALSRARHNLRSFGPAVKLAQSDFIDVRWVLERSDIPQVDGILLDLGVSSMQIDTASRGFSFRQSGPLDMRIDPGQKLSAAEVVNSYAESDLIRILRAYGEERHAQRIARAIVDARRKGPIRTTTELAQLVESSYPHGPRRGHPARRTFQAIRVEVNRELDVLEGALRISPDILAPGGRIVVISYQSLEDRIAKRVFASFEGKGQSLPGLGTPRAQGVFSVLTPNAILPSQPEIERNPRASAARLRAAMRRAS